MCTHYIARAGLGVKSSQSVAEMSTSSGPARYLDAVDWGEMVEKLQEKEERLEKMVKEYEDLWKEKEERSGCEHDTSTMCHAYDWL